MFHIFRNVLLQANTEPTMVQKRHRRSWIAYSLYYNFHEFPMTIIGSMGIFRMEAKNL